MDWNDLLGQERAIRILRAAVEFGREAHAYLFVGPQGTGKLEAARLLAATLQCLRPAHGAPCGSCIACRKWDTGHHPDVLLVSPPTREILIWQIVEREESHKQGCVPVRSFLALRPGEGRYKVVIISGADRLRQEAANALLKTLEEPPPYGVLILTTTNPVGVLDTLRSRCQTVSFSPVPLQLIVDKLVRDGMPMGQARLLAALSGGSLGRVRDLAEYGALPEMRRQARALLEELASLNDAEALNRVDTLDGLRQELAEFLDLTLLWLRDALVWSQTNNQDLMAAIDALDFVSELSKRYSRDVLMTMIEAVAAARYGLDRNVTTRLVLDVMMMKLTGLARTQTAVGSAGLT